MDEGSVEVVDAVAVEAESVRLGRIVDGAGDDGGSQRTGVAAGWGDVVVVLAGEVATLRR